jgi:hypothetical protein
MISGHWRRDVTEKGYMPVFSGMVAISDLRPFFKSAWNGTTIHSLQKIAPIPQSYQSRLHAVTCSVKE